MDASAREIYDVVGVGFGPSNLSLAIALEEHETNGSARPLRAAFFDRQPSFGWHRNMLLPTATMQISFLKDLATFRNPRSRYSFIAYLHASGRLVQFVNNQSFFPTREEFHRYLEWVAASFDDRVAYGAEVTAIRQATGLAPDERQLLHVEVCDGTGRRSTVQTRNVAISTGLVPRMPTGVECDDRVWHSSQFLEKFHRVDPHDLKRVAVVGGGQSAAEITRFLHDTLPDARVYAVVPSYGYSVADDTPFANQVFDPGAVDDYYFGTEQTREAFWHYHKNTNYSVVDDEIIRDLHRRSYDEDVRNDHRLTFLNLTRVQDVQRVGTEIHVGLDSLLVSDARTLDVDALVFATGYNGMEPTGLLGELDRHCLRDEAGRYRTERDYRIITAPELDCGIYLQGGTEHTHGLTSSLLSNVAVRSGEIADSVAHRSAGDDLEDRRTPATALGAG
ncbi:MULTISPECIES: lysine N(6)-hydroxylase/L-ornithine N(5)-oxygenase family protein [unclassified Streptomyces]|uniref:lysine N(6)-hydroxylase/L-ornithine N(5)-oxygenase family protein n=1 Tax=unclassified Streptomyces TaxID=2593676 RepID=UPI00365BEFA6